MILFSQIIQIMYKLLFMLSYIMLILLLVMMRMQVAVSKMPIPSVFFKTIFINILKVL